MEHFFFLTIKLLFSWFIKCKLLFFFSRINVSERKCYWSTFLVLSEKCFILYRWCMILLEFLFFFYFFLPMHGRKSIVLKLNFRTVDFDGFLRFEIHESENHIFSGWSLFVCVISISQKLITVETSNWIFYIYIIRRCYLKLFMKLWQKLCVQGHTKEF